MTPSKWVGSTLLE